MAEPTTRERIIEAGARIIHKNGFNNTGIKEILDASGVPKGSFYFYFKNKEDFGLQVVDYFSAHFGGKALALLADDSLPPLGRLRAMLRWFRDFYEDGGCTLGCPAGNLAQEMGDLSPAFREKLTSVIEGMARMMAGPLAEAQARGELPPGLEPMAAARFMVSAWHGALVRMKVEKSVAPLDLFDEMIFDRLLACTGAPDGATGGTG